MMVTRRDARTDANQPEILEALRKVGAWAKYIKWPLDLLVGFRGALTLMEVKMPGEELTDNQAEIIRALMTIGIIVPVVETPEDALKSIGAIRIDE